MVVHDSDGHNAACNAAACREQVHKIALTTFTLAEQQEAEEVLGLLPRELLLADALVYGIADPLGLGLPVQPLSACFGCLVRGRAEEDVEGVFVEGERPRGHGGTVRGAAGGRRAWCASGIATAQITAGSDGGEGS